MLKKWPILVMTLAMAGVANAAITPKDPDKDTNDGCYLISNADELYGFAALVNAGNATACGKLDANITVNENVLGANNANVNADGSYNTTLGEPENVWTPIGSSSTSAFKGSFNGQGHTISGLYFNNSETDNVGLFGYTSGAVTIDNVGLVDSYFRGDEYVGSIVGQAALVGTTKKLTVIRSYNKGVVTGTGNVGGLVGKNGNVKFSYNTGSVTGTSNVGGLVGSNILQGQNKFEINGSYNVGLVKMGTGSGNAVLGEGCPTGSQTGAVKNVYYLDGFGAACLGALPMTSYEFADGFVAIMLHNDRTVTGADIWGQVVGADKTPTLTGEIRFLLKDVCFEIANEEDLYLFAGAVNSGVNSEVCAKLTADIKVNEHVLADAIGVPKVNSDGAYTSTDSASFRKWTPIGNADHPFIGTFDGDGHTISGLYFNDYEKNNVGLFGYVESSESVDVSIKNVGLEDSYFKAKGKVGGVVGLVGDNVDVKIENVYNAAVVTDGGSSGYVGGIVGVFWAYESPSALNILNSYNSGAVFGNKSVGGLVGDVEDRTSASTVSIKNSYNYGAVTAFDNQGETLVGSVAGTSVNISDTYYLKNSALKSSHGGTEMSSTQFSDGTVFAQLHSAENGSVWKQYQGDAYPSFAAKSGTGAVPMHVATLQYPDAEHEGQYKTEYVAFVEGVAKKLPVLDKNGNPLLGWSESGKDQPITEIPATKKEGVVLFPKPYEPAADGCYEIADANQLYLFAAVVNGSKSKVCGKLTANICVNACGEGESVLGTDNANVNADGSYNNTQAASAFRAWTPIGIADYPFIGTFDGQGHTISGLYFNDAGSEYIGLFGVLSTATIKNIGVEDSYFRGSNYVGGILSLVDSDANVNIENVYNAAVVVGEDCAGGVIGGDLGSESHVTNAYNVGLVLSGTSAGGIVGFNFSDYETAIQNSFNYGTVSANGEPGALVGYVDDEHGGAGFSVTNSFYLGDAPNGGYGEYKSASDFENGTVLAALQSNADGYIWTQGDKYPKFGTYEPVDDCYEIATASQLYWFAAIVNNGNGNVCGKLTADIVVNENVLATAGGVSNVNATTGAYTGTTTGLREWTPIGNGTNPFQGKFDGQGHSVSGLYFNGENVYDVGLFGRVAGDANGASIENVEVADSYFGNSGETGDHVGGVVGMVTHGGVVNVKNVSSAAVVVGNDYVGGIVGYVLGTEGDLKLNIANAYNVGMVKGSNGVGGLVGDVTNDRVENKIAINNSYNYGDVSFKMNGGGAPLIGTVVNNGSLATIDVDNSYFLADKSSGFYGENKTATEFANGTVLTALRKGEDGNVWVQNLGDIYPTININGTTNPYTLVLDWQSADDLVNLRDSLNKYSSSYGTLNVVVKSGKTFYAGGKIYSGNISTADVSDICDNNKMLYPISGVQLATDGDGITTATLNGKDDARTTVMIPTDVQVDKVIYKRNITANTYMTIMLPFDVDVENNTSVKGKYTFYKFCGVGSDAEGTIINVAPVTTKFKANRPYIMIANAGNSEGITFEKVGDSKYTLNTTTLSTDASEGNWTMRGVYEYKVWPEGDSDLGYVYGFANKAGSDNQIGEFVEAGAGADIVPMRMYLKEIVSQGVRGNGKYNYSSHTGPAKVVRVQIVEGDGDDETTAIKHVATVPTVVKSNRWFDVKGRALNGKPTAKGTYYYNGQRVIIK